MAGLLPSVINKSFLTCQVCLDSYKQPKILPCIHTFCQICLQQCTVGLATENSSFPCPVCRAKTPIPPGGVKAFKTNFFIASLQDVVITQSRTGMLCDNCSDSPPATTRCMDCRDNLCDDCTEAHRRTKLTRAHKLFSMSELQTGKYEKEFRESQAIFCEVHHEPLKLYCCDCDKAICFNCKVTEHEGHRASNLKDMGQEGKDMLRHLLGRVQTRIITMEGFLKNLSQYETAFAKQKDYTTAIIKERCLGLHEAIEKYTKRALNELDNLTDCEEQDIDAYRKTIKNHSKQLKEVSDFTTKILSYGTDTEVVTMCKGLEQRLAKLQAMPCSDFVQKQKIDLRLSVPDTSHVNQMMLYGKLERHNNGSVFAPHITKGTCIRTFECSSETDENVSYICSIAVTPDNNLVVLDQNNHKVKIFNGCNGQLVGEFRFGEKLKSPIALTIMPDGKVAILDETRGIRVFSRSGRYVRQVYCPVKTPMGLSTDDDNHLLITDRRTKAVHVTNLDGSYVDSTSHEKGKPLFQKPCGIISTPGNKRVVADIGTNSIKVLNPEGRLEAEYGSKGAGDGEINIPICLCTDQYGHIIVADYNNHRIHLLDSKAQFITYLVEKSDGIFRPTSIVINNEGHLIIAKDTGTIKIYRYID